MENALRLRSLYQRYSTGYSPYRYAGLPVVINLLRNTQIDVMKHEMVMKIEIKIQSVTELSAKRIGYCNAQSVTIE